MWLASTAVTAPGGGSALTWARSVLRTGGPDDDGGDDLQMLMPILAAVIVLAVVFG